jgi:hypothetical protein
MKNKNKQFIILFIYAGFVIIFLGIFIHVIVFIFFIFIYVADFLFCFKHTNKILIKEKKIYLKIKKA